ncbi:hypothetical protein KGM_202606 [Danaus plexippus plexippus]|uniref:PiggyBac transposable element-derived protein domain-containing protein n=1 Tax=Danaus plexippus plexippus TaxID=278856 RepID=A0A212FFX4_DANPL|nr:hypothetical protein KGM_202606 [Danaus plexippus plexippus]
MGEEEIWQLLDNIPTDDEGTDDDNDDDVDSDQGAPNLDFMHTEDELEPLTDESQKTEIPTNTTESGSAVSTICPIVPEQLDQNEEIISLMPDHTEEIAVQESAKPYRRRKRPRTPEPTEEEDGPVVQALGVVDDVADMKNDSPQFKSIVWKKKNLHLHVNEVVFRGQKELPETITRLDTPYKCFRYFMNDALFDHLVEQSNLYARQKNIRTNFSVQSVDLRKFVGILLYMSVYRYPNVRSYWGNNSFEAIRQTMPVLRFEAIRRYLHYNDNAAVVTRDLGAASNVVVRLSKQIPNFVNHILYFDNFYTSLGLLTYLRSRGIYSLGTVRVNRVPNCKLSSDAILQQKKVDRGYSEEFVGTAYGIDISSVLWNDTKTVRLLSTYVGVKPFASKNINKQISKVTRWDRKKKTHYDIDCPQIIKEYNRHMGGVDLMDGLLGRYHIRMKTRKWTNRIFYHMVDVAMVNAYILYHRLHPHADKIELPTFRTQVAESLCVCGTIPVKRSVGRPSNTTPPPKIPTAKRAYLPTDDIRYDQIGHWCVFRDRSGKKQCKYPKCKSETQAYCTKCNLSLCSSTTKTCFYDFHNK